MCLCWGSTTIIKTRARAPAQRLTWSLFNLRQTTTNEICCYVTCLGFALHNGILLCVCLYNNHASCVPLQQSCATLTWHLFACLTIAWCPCLCLINSLCVRTELASLVMYMCCFNQHKVARSMKRCFVCVCVVSKQWLITVTMSGNLRKYGAWNIWWWIIKCPVECDVQYFTSECAASRQIPSSFVWSWDLCVVAVCRCGKYNTIQ